MRGSADSLILQKSNARTMKMRKSDLWLAFCAHQISWILWSKVKPCFWLGFCASWNCEFQWFQKSASHGGLPKKCIIIEKALTGARISMLPVPAGECFLWDVMKIPVVLLKKSTNELSPVTELLIIGLILTYGDKLYESFYSSRQHR